MGFPISWLLNLASSHSKHLQKLTLLLKRLTGSSLVLEGHKKEADRINTTTEAVHRVVTIKHPHCFSNCLFSSDPQGISLASRLWREIASKRTLIWMQYWTKHAVYVYATKCVLVTFPGTWPKDREIPSYTADNEHNVHLGLTVHQIYNPNPFLSSLAFQHTSRKEISLFFSKSSNSTGLCGFGAGEGVQREKAAKRIGKRKK